VIGNIEIINAIESALGAEAKQEKTYIDPWLKKAEFSVKDDVIFPEGPGVYIFTNMELRKIYYIGKADIGLSARLNTKLREDYRDQRTLQRECGSGFIFHEYPYLTEYQKHKTTVYTMETDCPAAVEKVLLASYLFATCNLPSANRTAGGSKKIIEKQEYWDKLGAVWEQVLKPICGDDVDYGIPRRGPRTD
jgi:hypothetical protein